METLIYFFGVIAFFAFNMLTASALAWLLTEFKGPLIRVKPFNCRPCLTFWLTFALGISLAIGIAGEAAPELRRMFTGFLVINAFLTALINYFYISSKNVIND